MLSALFDIVLVILLLNNAMVIFVMLFYGLYNIIKQWHILPPGNLQMHHPSGWFIIPLLLCLITGVPAWSTYFVNCGYRGYNYIFNYFPFAQPVNSSRLDHGILLLLCMSLTLMGVQYMVFEFKTISI